MNRVEEIKQAIDRLPPREFRRFAQWFRERDQQLWDRQLDADNSSARIEFLFEEAEKESGKGLLREWPPKK